jgi:hypothetical protein
MLRKQKSLWVSYSVVWYILEAVKTLKNGKSAAGNLLSNEMIKYGFPVLIEPILKLFNLIFEKGDFPQIMEWKLYHPPT